MDLTNKQIEIEKYPNTLAHLKIYPHERRVEILDVKQQSENEDMPQDKKNSKKQSKKDKANKNVDSMWKYMSMGKIDISYACVGYSYDGRPILDYTAFIDLLVNYGFKIEDVLIFIDDFASCTEKDDKAPIVMTNINTSRIMTEINPLKNA